jgi:hypothetical protein
LVAGVNGRGGGQPEAGQPEAGQPESGGDGGVLSEAEAPAVVQEVLGGAEGIEEPGGGDGIVEAIEKVLGG